MADEIIAAQNDGRRRSSHPAMKLGVPLPANESAASPQSSSEDVFSPDATKNNQERRHSVDVLVASPERPLFANSGQTHKVWAHIAKISGPKDFDPKSYDKEELPQGSSIFKAVLADLEEKEEGNKNSVAGAKLDSENTDD